MTVTEAELTALVLATRDRTAFGELVLRHGRVVRAMLYRLTRDWALAEDLAQDAFVRAFERIDQYAGHGSFRNWLCRIAYTEFLRSARRRRSGDRVRTMLAGEADGEAGPSPDAALGAAIDIDRALSRLGAAERAALVLCYGCGFSHSEAAGAMGLPVGTVKSHVLRGRKKVAGMLAAGNKER